MDKQQLEAIRARDADYNDVFEAQASMSKDIAHRLVAWPVADRRALLAYVDALAAENAALKAQLAYAASTGDECAIEVESLRKDAERYRWLRSQPMRDGCDLVHVELMDWNEDGPTHVWYAYDADGLDAAIDAAMGENRE